MGIHSINITNSQIRTMLILRRRNNDELFAKLPIDLVKNISEFVLAPPEFTEALRHVAYGELSQVKELLDKDNTLLLYRGAVATRAGLIVSNTTLLQCAIGAGDPEMAAVIMSCFSDLPGGRKEVDRQFESYRPHIETILTQKPYDLTRLIECIMESSSEDVTAALNTIKNHKSKLHDALTQFREDAKPIALDKPKMHYNFSTLIHAFKLYERECEKFSKGSNTKKAKLALIWRQVIGYLQRGIPAVDRFAFATGIYKLATSKQPLIRKSDAESWGSFPDTANEDPQGLGYQYAIFDRKLSGFFVEQKHILYLKNYIGDKQSNLRELLEERPEAKSRRCAMS